MGTHWEQAIYINVKFNLNDIHEIIIFEIVFGMVHRQQYEGFQKIFHILISIISKHYFF